MLTKKRANGGSRRGNGQGALRRNGAPLRWAVVGLGHFAQTSVLPAFGGRDIGEMKYLVTSDPRKARALGRKYKAQTINYDGLTNLDPDSFDVAYVTLPNHLHHDVTMRLLHAGKHVLCEKPMAVTVKECREMKQAAIDAGVRLMIGYRLHFEKANMMAVDLIRAGRIGRVRYFVSAFSFQLDDENVRTMPTEQGGGALYDVGVYCINAARYLFREEPIRVTAFAAGRADDKRFSESHEQIAATLEFPGGKLATFVVSFGAAGNNFYSVGGTEGTVALERAYNLNGPMDLVMTPRKGRTVRRHIRKHDQIAPEIAYFSKCIREGSDPEPSADEGLADVAVIEAILKSAREGKPVPLKIAPTAKPHGGLVQERRARSKPRPIHASGPNAP